MPYRTVRSGRVARKVEATQLHHLIAETIPQMVWTARPEGTADYLNRRVLEYTGLEARALEGEGWLAIVHPEDRPRCAQAWARALASGERYEMEVRLRRRDGAYRWHLDCAQPLRDAAGRILKWFGTRTDIEERKNAAQALERVMTERTLALRESEARFQLFMENSPAIAWIKDSQLRYVYASSPFLRAHGRKFEELAGRDVFAVWPEAVARELDRHDRAVLESGSAKQSVETVPYADGGEGAWLVVKFPMPDRSGAPGVAGVAIDITVRAGMERQLVESAARIRELMKRLVETQEAERRRVAADLHDVVGQNLSALGVLLEIVRGEVPRGLTARLCDRLDDMERLLQETTQVAREVIADLRPTVLDDYGLVPALDWYAQEFATRSGIRVTVEGKPIEPRLPDATELALFRIAQEALSNASKHSGAARIRIAVARGNGGVRLVVEDDGRGFAEPSGARAAQRGGFGLPAMRERAEAIGGTLRIETAGPGTRVVVEVPTAHADPGHPG